jgi:hypothetical protein
VTAPAYDPPPAGQPIRVEFTYDLADFVEASRAASAQAKSGSAAVPKALWGIPRSILGWVLFVGLAVMLFLLLNHRQQSPRRTPPRPVAAPTGDWVHNVLVPVLPWAVLFLAVWVLSFLQMRRQAGKTPAASGESLLLPPGTPPPPPRPRSDPTTTRPPLALLWLLAPAAGLAITLALTLRFTGNPGSAAPLDLSAVLFSTVPWVVIGLVLWLFITRSSDPLKKLWEASPSMHRPQVVEADEQRIVFSDAAGRFEQRWEAFSHVQETDGIFLLYTGQLSAQFIPKRAFASAAELDAFRELLRRHVAQRPAPAFPVLPVVQPVDSRPAGQ